MLVYDIFVYVQKGEKKFVVNIVEQWKVVGSLLLDLKGSLLGQLWFVILYYLVYIVFLCLCFWKIEVVSLY